MPARVSFASIAAGLAVPERVLLFLLRLEHGLAAPA
jgi:hypothetical protein